MSQDDINKNTILSREHEQTCNGIADKTTCGPNDLTAAPTANSISAL